MLRYDLFSIMDFSISVLATGINSFLKKSKNGIPQGNFFLLTISSGRNSEANFCKMFHNLWLLFVKEIEN